MSTSLFGDFSIQLPDLDAAADSEVVTDNLLAVQTIYVAAMLEEMKMFSVVDRLVALFSSGQLPVGRGSSGERLFQYWRHTSDRLSEKDRRDLYSRTFGFPGGDAGATPNREFEDLWYRFVAAVAGYNGAPEAVWPIMPPSSCSGRCETSWPFC